MFKYHGDSCCRKIILCPSTGDVRTRVKRCQLNIRKALVEGIFLSGMSLRSQWPVHQPETGASFLSAEGSFPLLSLTLFSPSIPRFWVVLWHMWSFLTPRRRFVLFPGTFTAVCLCLYHNAYHETAGKFTSHVQKVYDMCLPIYIAQHTCMYLHICVEAIGVLLNHLRMVAWIKMAPVGYYLWVVAWSLRNDII